MNRLIDLALDKQSRMKQGKYAYPDDDAFIIPREQERYWSLGSRDHHATIKPQKLLKNDGTIVTRSWKVCRWPVPRTPLKTPPSKAERLS